MKTVRVATGFSRVQLPDGGVYNGGQIINLTDEQYNSIPDFVKKQLVVLLSQPDLAPAPVRTTPSSFTSDLIYDELASMGVPIYLIWDGSDYQPSVYKAATDRPKTFIGPSDPSTFAGVVLRPRDQWINS